MIACRYVGSPFHLVHSLVVSHVAQLVGHPRLCLLAGQSLWDVEQQREAVAAGRLVGRIHTQRLLMALQALLIQLLSLAEVIHIEQRLT